MKRYRNLYAWMIIPMVIMQLGIFMDYWGDFTDNAWTIHIHYWTGTLWYLYLIIQPYYATHNKMQLHRTNGIIGMFIAGGVAFTALSMMHRDMVLVQLSRANPERFGPFEPWFFFGVAAIEIVMISAFIIAVVKSIVHRKELENHAWWLISSVFIIMMPALARGFQAATFMIKGFGPDVGVMGSVYVTNLLIIILAIWGALKFGRLKHPATYLVVGVNLFNCLLEPLGKSEFIQIFLETVIKG